MSSYGLEKKLLFSTVWQFLAFNVNHHAFSSTDDPLKEGNYVIKNVLKSTAWKGIVVKTKVKGWIGFGGIFKWSVQLWSDQQMKCGIECFFLSTSSRHAYGWSGTSVHRQSRTIEVMLEHESKDLVCVWRIRTAWPALENDAFAPDVCSSKLSLISVPTLKMVHQILLSITHPPHPPLVVEICCEVIMAESFFPPSSLQFYLKEITKVKLYRRTWLSLLQIFFWIQDFEL